MHLESRFFAADFNETRIPWRIEYLQTGKMLDGLTNNRINERTKHLKNA